jgi:hypothetical protein
MQLIGVNDLEDSPEPVVKANFVEGRDSDIINIDRPISEQPTPISHPFINKVENA